MYVTRIKNRNTIRKKEKERVGVKGKDVDVTFREQIAKENV